MVFGNSSLTQLKVIRFKTNNTPMLLQLSSFWQTIRPPSRRIVEFLQQTAYPRKTNQACPWSMIQFSSRRVTTLLAFAGG
jgi:hypothetical protein